MKRRIHNSELGSFLQKWTDNIKEIIPNKLMGIYIFGSVILDDFQKGISDIDFLVVTKKSINKKEQQALKKMHTMLIKESLYAKQLEGEYAEQKAISVSGIKGKVTRCNYDKVILNTKSETTPCILFYIQKAGINLYGPPAKEIIPVLSKSEVQKAMFDYINKKIPKAANQAKIKQEDPKLISSDLLNMCRGLYAIKENKPISKTKVGKWALLNLDKKWQPLIKSALLVRHQKATNKDIELLKKQSLNFFNYIRQEAKSLLI